MNILQYINENISMFFALSSLLFTFNIIIFYLDDFYFSSNFFIKYLQIFTFVLFIFLSLILALNQYNVLDIICFANDNDNITLKGQVNVSKEAAKEFSKGMNTIGTQIGLGATIVGVSTAVGKTIAKSGMPPIQKAGVVIGGAFMGGLSHSIISRINRNNIEFENQKTTNTTESLNSNISKLIDNSITSPLEGLISDIQLISITCLSLIFILTIQIVFKFHIKDNLNFNLFFFNKNVNDKLGYYFNKIIYLNKKMSSIYI